MIANKSTAAGAGSRVPFHSRMQSTTARFLATAIQDDLRRGNMNDLKSHMSNALDSVDQTGNLDARARAEIYLAVGEGARALGEIEKSEALARRVVAMHGGNLLDVIAAAERLQALLLLDKGDKAGARRVAQSIDKLHVIRPHAETLLDGEDENVTMATHLVIAEIELADRQLPAAISAVERALTRLDKERSDDPISRDTCNALMLIKGLVFACAGDQKARARLYELQSEWSGNAAISAALRARLALLLDSVDYGLVTSAEGVKTEILNPKEAERWAYFKTLVNDASTPIAPAVAASAELTGAGGALPAAAVESAPMLATPPPDYSSASVAAGGEEDLLRDLEHLIDTALPSKSAQASVSPGSFVGAEADVIELDLPEFENLQTAPAPAATSTPLLGDLVIRLDVMGFDIIIQGLERAAKTGKLDFIFDDGTVAQARAEGARLDEIPDCDLVTGGALFFANGLLIDACLNYKDGRNSDNDPNAALALLAQISIGSACSVQASFTRSSDAHENRFGTHNNTSLLLSILTRADEGNLITVSVPTEPTSLEVAGADRSAQVSGGGLAVVGDSLSGLLSPRALLDILNAASPAELCESLSRALQASCVELLYGSESLAAVGSLTTDREPIRTHYGDFSIIIQGHQEAAAHTYTDREQALIEMAYNRLFAMPRGVRASDLALPSGAFPDDIIATSKLMFELFGLVHRLAQFDGTELPMAHILITGETGVGKEIVANMIHTCSGRRDKRFIPVNSASILDDLATATIFGAKKGSYTGADADRPGLIAAADGGTLFLDEIGNTSERLQAQLLRVTQDGTYQRLGDPEKRTANVRFVMATNQNIDDADAFKNDLKHRCQVIIVPPLRARREDIRPLAERFAKRNGVTLNESAFLWLERQDWPGNVRELGQFIQRAAAQAGSGATINLSMLSSISQQNASYAPPLPPLLAGETYADALSRIEAGYLSLVLSQQGRNMNQAAKLFGTNRNTFINRLRAHNLNSERSE